MGPDRELEAISWEPVAELIRAHGDWLCRALRRRFGQTVSPEDILQETYLRASTLRELRHPRAALLTIASRLAADHLRRRRTADRYVQSVGPGDEGAPPDQVELVLLKEVLASMPESLRETFVLNRFGGLSYQEIAQRQGVSVKTVEWRIGKALAHCVSRLSL